MASDLDELKAALAKDPAAKGYYAATQNVRVIGNKVHSLSHCDATRNLNDYVLLALGEVLKLDYSHKCMKRGYFKLNEAARQRPLSLIKLLKFMDKIPHHDEFVANKPSQETLEFFLKLFIKDFGNTLLNPNAAAPQATLNWLNARKGYPADADEIMQIFAAQAIKTSSRYIAGSGTDTFTCDEKQRRLIIVVPSDLTINLALRSSSVEAVMTFLVLREHFIAGTNLAVVPQSFRYNFRYNSSIRDSEKINVNEDPSTEKLLTLDMLINSGMTLKEAWLPASKLS